MGWQPCAGRAWQQQQQQQRQRPLQTACPLQSLARRDECMVSFHHDRCRGLVRTIQIHCFEPEGHKAEHVELINGS